MSLPSTHTATDTIPSASLGSRLLVANQARRAGAITLDTPFPLLSELLRVSPYRMLPVVEWLSANANGHRDTPLLGIVTEKNIADTLLFTTSDTERERLRRSGVAADFLTTLHPDDCVLPGDTAHDLCERLDRLGMEALPVIDSRERNLYRGMVSRADMVRDLVRPLQPPTIGGMATPLGVYLTDGMRSGGAGALALAATGIFTTCLHMVGIVTIFLTTSALEHFAHGLVALAGHIPLPLQDSLSKTIPLLVQFALFLTMLRHTPLAGYHAAEHQVVHTVERGEPLLPEIVRTMPRVHPRCSTNLVAGMLIFLLIGTGLTPIVGAEVAYMIGAMGTFLWWKPVGSWLQQYATTRPASDKEIASGIKAARELLSAQDAPLTTASTRLPAPLVLRFTRIWRMGFVQILLGGAVTYGLLALLSLLWPDFRNVFTIR